MSKQEALTCNILSHKYISLSRGPAESDPTIFGRRHRLLGLGGAPIGGSDRHMQHMRGCCGATPVPSALLPAHLLFFLHGDICIPWPGPLPWYYAPHHNSKYMSTVLVFGGTAGPWGVLGSRHNHAAMVGALSGRAWGNNSRHRARPKGQS